MNKQNQRGWLFPPQLFKEQEEPTLMTTEEEDIRESLHILLSTRRGERPHRSEYGTDLHTFLFEQMDLSIETQIKKTIETAVFIFEPRISLDRIEINKDRLETGTIIIELYYTILSVWSPENQVYSYLYTLTNE